VVEIPPGGIEVAVEVGQIASMPGRIGPRAEALAPTRTLAAVRALRFGLYVPYPLGGTRESGAPRS
jgi:hypothetical protein